MFGVWEDSDAALPSYLRVAEDLHAGRQPRFATLPEGSVNVKQMCNHYLTHQVRRSQAGEVGHRWFEDCRGMSPTIGFAGMGLTFQGRRPILYSAHRI